VETSSRKWLLTINNPTEKGFDHTKIKEELQKLKPTKYFCLTDEIGLESKTPHTHVFAVFSSPVRFSTLKKIFPPADLENARGKIQECIDYIRKSGKWENSEKKETSVPDSFEEWGEIPVERQGARNDLTELYGLVKGGATNYEIMEENPDFMLHLDKIERARQAIKSEEYRSTFRELHVTYIWGATGTGKTRSVMDEHGYVNVYRVTDYSHPFDGYKGEDIVVFDEYRGQFKIHDLLNYLDGYPLELPCRYTNKQACYTKVYIISNIPLNEQYQLLQISQPATYAALIRRIHKIVKFPYEPIQTTIDDFIEITDEDSENPFLNAEG